MLMYERNLWKRQSDFLLIVVEIFWQSLILLNYFVFLLCTTDERVLTTFYHIKMILLIKDYLCEREKRIKYYVS